VILFAYANDRSPDGRYLKDLPEECRANKAALEDAEDGHHVELITRMNATLEDVIAACQKYRDRIVGVHFAGHSDGESVVFERRDGSPAAATAASFADFLGELPALQWAFLNGCATQGQVEALRSRGVPVVLATSTLVRDDVAQTVSFYFYLGMARGETLEAAFRHATVDTRFKFSADRRSPSAGLYRDLDEASVPAEHVPWEIHGDDAARQRRLVPTGSAHSPHALPEPSRPSDSGRLRRLERYQVAVTGCLIALAIAAVVSAAVVKVWSFIGTTEPAAPASRNVSLQRDRDAIAAQLVVSQGSRTRDPSQARAEAATTQPDGDGSATSHALSQPEPTRPPPAQKAATSPRSPQSGALRRHVAERDRLPPRAELPLPPSALPELDKETVRRRIRSQRNELKFCYEQQLLYKPTLRGTVQTRFLITPAGKVASLEVSGLDPDVSSCVAAAIRNTEFPRSSNSIAVNYPFYFHPIGSDVE
jgi:hypothetical protein